jgi:lysozyme family protein
MTPEEKRVDMGKAIVDFEARRKDGKLRVYKLPAGDGGGSFEIAGINEKFHSETAHELKDLIESGQHELAEHRANTYIEEYTRTVLSFFPSDVNPDNFPHIEFLLRDSCWNRGSKGAATILQLALGMKSVDGVVGPRTKIEFGYQLEDPAEVGRRITQARETYERNTYPWKKNARDESSKFWKGLANRWAKAHQTAMNRFA